VYIKDSPVRIGAVGDHPFHGNRCGSITVTRPRDFRGRRMDTKILLDEFAARINIVDQFESTVSDGA
jgi:hypothetical protein